MRPGRNSAAIISAAIVVLLVLSPGVPSGSSQTQNEAASSAPLHYGEPQEVAVLKDERIDESSGIAASIRYEDAFWTHNDSGDSARIFLFNKKGETMAMLSIKGASSRDWEDIASFRLGSDSYVLIGDVGDNGKRREDCVLYIIREPEIGSGNPEGLSIEVEPVWTIHFSYEDGTHDCEAVAVDPTSSTIYLVSKERDECKVYSMPIPQGGSKEPNVARAIATVKLRYPNAMDISPDGRRAVISTYNDVYEYSRTSGETWALAFSREPRVIKAPARRQGEAICYGSDGKTLYLTSENEAQPLWEIPVIEGGK